MSEKSSHRYLVIASAIVIAGVLVSAGLFASAALKGTVTKTTTENSTEIATTTLTTATTTTLISSGGAQTAQPGPLLLSKTWGPWVYNVSLSATLVNPGQFLFVSGDLTYTGQSNTTIAVVEPDISVIVYNSTGGVAWEFSPPPVTSSNLTLFEDVYSGRNLGGGQLCIPISVVSLNNSCSSPYAFNETPQPGVYTMQIEPPFYSPTTYQDSGANLTITADFTILSNSSLVVSQTATETSIQCVILGQPGPMFLRVLSDSNQTSVAGAVVKATNQPASCNDFPATGQKTVSFATTSGTEWYSLDTENDAGYSFAVTYLGQTYAFSASLRPLSSTCVTLHVPSGRTNVTITEFQTTC